MKRILSILFAMVMMAGIAKAQNPVTWSMDVKMTTKTEGVVKLTAKILPGWHLYDTALDPSIGPKPTKITFTTPAGLKWKSAVKPSIKPTKQRDDMWEAVIGFWGKNVTFSRPFKLTGKKPVSVTATVSYQACNDENCTADTQKFTKTISPKK